MSMWTEGVGGAVMVARAAVRNKGGRTVALQHRVPERALAQLARDVVRELDAVALEDDDGGHGAGGPAEATGRRA